MLSRELCEKLAEAYPRDITMHALEDIDVAYGAAGAYPHLQSELFDAPGELLWCPSLEDLLAIAVNKANSMGTITLNLTCATWSPHWELSVRKADMAVTDDIMFHEIAAIGFTNTAEEAVALWLLQIAGEGKEENP